MTRRIRRSETALPTAEIPRIVGLEFSDLSLVDANGTRHPVSLGGLQQPLGDATSRRVLLFADIARFMADWLQTPVGPDTSGAPVGVPSCLPVLSSARPAAAAPASYVVPALSPAGEPDDVNLISAFLRLFDDGCVADLTTRKPRPLVPAEAIGVRKRARGRSHSRLFLFATALAREFPDPDERQALVRRLRTMGIMKTEKVVLEVDGTARKAYRLDRKKLRAARDR